MKPEIAEIWATELEKGEKKKTRSTLRRGEKSFCCLGVLCEIYRQETGEGEWIKDEDGLLFDDGISDSDAANLPRGVREWAEMAGASGATRFGSLMSMNHEEFYSLVSINDDTNKSFKDIAKIIRKNVENL